MQNLRNFEGSILKKRQLIAIMLHGKINVIYEFLTPFYLQAVNFQEDKRQHEIAS